VSRIAAKFADLKKQGRGALIPFVEAWDPDQETSTQLLLGMPGAGADLIEVGFPFSDPMAEGPPIQRAAQRALAKGMTLKGTLELIGAFRGGDQTTQVILMGYMNPLVTWGFEAFARDSAAAGVDGVIVVDCPPEEADPLADALEANGMALIFLTTPTTDDHRLPTVLRRASGFVYYVSITGITGTRSASTAQLSEAIPRIRRVTDLPIAIGFGVRSPAQAAEASRVADAAVVASALIDTMAHSLDASGKALPGTVEKILDQVRALAAGVRGQPV